MYDFLPNSDRQDISVAIGATVPTLGSGKFDFFRHSSTSAALVVLSFRVQLFSPTFVTFQDSKSKKTIGKGTYSHGLYLLNPPICWCKVATCIIGWDILPTVCCHVFFLLFLLSLVCGDENLDPKIEFFFIRNPR